MITKRQLLKLFAICTVLTVTTNFPSGFTNSSINTAVTALTQFINQSYNDRHWKLTDEEQVIVRSVTLNCWYVFQIFGFIFAPQLTDRFGRKVSYITASLGMLFASIIQFIASILAAPEMLIIGRSVCAFCSPISDASLLLYLQECTPLEMRGAFSFMGEVGYSSMCLLGMILGMRRVLGDSLPHLLGISVVFQLCFIMFLVFLPETPKFLMIIRRDRAKALKSLQFFQGVQEEHETLLEVYAEEAAQEEVQESNLKTVLTTWHLRQAVILACLVIVLTLSFFPMLQSSTLFFIKATISSKIAELSSTILMVFLATSSAIGSLFVDRFPRRTLLLTFGSLSHCFLLFFVICSLLTSFFWWMKYASLFCMACYIVTYAMVVGPMSWFIGPELVPQRYRATVFCLCFTICNILIAITNFLCVLLYEKIGAAILIPLFIVPSILALIYLFLYLPETRNRQPHEVIASMRRSSKVVRKYERVDSAVTVY